MHERLEMVDSRLADINAEFSEDRVEFKDKLKFARLKGEGFAEVIEHLVVSVEASVVAWSDIGDAAGEEVFSN